MSAYTTADRAQAVALYREHGPTEAARRTGVPKSTVSRWAKAQGIRTSAVSPRTAAATAASSEQARAVRTEVARLTLDTAEAVLDHLTRRLAVEADTLPLKDLAVIAGILFDKHIALTRVDGNNTDDHNAVDAWLNHIIAGEVIDDDDPRHSQP